MSEFEAVEQTFLGIQAADAHRADVAIFGAVHGTAYPGSLPVSNGSSGPDAVRRAITAASLHIDHWDFDFDGPLLHDGKLTAVDCGNIPTRFNDCE